MRVLYFEPAIYYPYKLNLRKNSSVVLIKIEIDGGATITPNRQDYRVTRPFKNDYLCVNFNTPHYMEVASLEGSLCAVTIFYHFIIEGCCVIHKQHIQLSGDAGKSPYYCLRDGLIHGDPQYSTFDGVPTTIGKEGLFMLKSTYDFKKDKGEVTRQLLGIEKSVGNVVIQYGILSGEENTIVMESYSHINPSCATKHGTLN